jgi:hypothetical protein
VPITRVVVDDPKNTGHDCHMESKPKHNPPLTRIYERFLELPVPLVLAVIWLAGVALTSVCGLALYYFWLALQAVAGG